MSTGLRRDRRQLTSARSLVSPKCLSGNISERKLAFSGCEQSLVPEGDLSRWRLRRLKNPMISRSGFRTDTQAIALRERRRVCLTADPRYGLALELPGHQPYGPAPDSQDGRLELRAVWSCTESNDLIPR